MKAAITTKYSNTLPLAEIVQIVSDFPKPTLQVHSSEMLIKVRYSSINPVDWKLMQGFGKMIFMFKKLPFPFGNDSCGEVVQIGSQVTKFKIGDIVSCGHVGGAFAEYRIVNESCVALKPQQLSDEFAASLPTVANTMFQSLQKVFDVSARLQNENKNVLIIGGSGGTGSVGIVLAKHMFGIGTVFTTCSTKNISFCETLGATKVFDYSKYSPSEIAEIIQNDLQKPLDLIIDCVGGTYDYANIFLNKSILKGKYITIASMVPEEKANFSSILGMGWFMLKKSMSRISGHPSFQFLMAESNGSNLQQILDFFGQHQELVALLPLQIFTLDKIVEALEMNQSHRVVGKLVIKVE